MTRFTSLAAKSLVTFLIAGGTLATNLQAQSDVAITARVPFPFTVGKHSIEPGTYQFSLLTSQFLLSVVNVKPGPWRCLLYALKNSAQSSNMDVSFSATLKEAAF
jgi:hypothetical protein